MLTFKDKLKFYIIDLIYITIIIFIIYFFVDFKSGLYLFTGDFRFNINKELFGDQFLSIISDKFSSNNFIFLPFYPLYYLLSFFNYNSVLTIIFFGIPIGLYLSARYLILNLSKFDYENYNGYMFYTSLAFFYSINPSLFDRFGHWTILFSFVFLPIYLLFVIKYFEDKSILNKYIYVIPFLLYIGAFGPQPIIIYFIFTVLIGLTYFNKNNIKYFLSKSFLIGFLWVIAFFHIFYSIFLGFGVSKSIHESTTTSNILFSLSKNSSVISSLSGTNYYADILSFFPFGAGSLLFLLLVSILIFQKKYIKNHIYLFYILLFIIITSGYKAFPGIFDFVLNTPFKNYIWIFKDPNMYYLCLILFIIIFLSRQTLKFSKYFYLYFSLIFVLFNIAHIFSADKDFYRSFYKFINIPNEYIFLSEDLNEIGGRNFWLPYDWYISKNFSQNISYFPSPLFWLTKNKELTDSTSEYKNLINVIQNEIYEKDCKNIYFIDWLISSQNLNIIIDRNSINNNILGVYDTEYKVLNTIKCMKKIKNVYNYKTVGNLDVYKSNLKIGKEIYEYFGNFDQLNKFLSKNNVNIIFKESNSQKLKKVDLNNYFILNESYDENWRNSNGEKPFYKVNLSSMLFYGNERKYYYKGKEELDKIFIIQRIIIIILLLIFTTKHILYERKK